MRSDKAKNRAKVLSEVVKDPFATERQIAKNTWLWKTTIHWHLEDIPKTTKSDQIEKIISKDIEIVNLATDILQDRLRKAKKPETDEDKMTTRDIIASADVSAKRYSLFKWDVTDKDWWYKSISQKDLDDIADILS